MGAALLLAIITLAALGALLGGAGMINNRDAIAGAILVVGALFTLLGVVITAKLFETR